MANLITLLRFPLFFLYLAGLYFGTATVQLWCAPFIAVIFFLDTVDGYVARRRGEVSLLGSAIDIATDRTLEVVLWVVFADLRLLPILLPLIAIVRGTTVDAVRAVGMSRGETAFEQMRHPFNRFLVSSRFMREVYGITKGVAFFLLTLDLWARTGAQPFAGTLHTAALLLAWLAIALNVLRGLPVLIEAVPLFRAGRSPEN
jgi:CDP-diacylglycerol--glycerol-3-phosphate 3-phosphatidyltransferase